MTGDRGPLARRRGAYGIDAPLALFGLGAGGVLLLVATVVNALQGVVVGAIITASMAALFLLSTASFLYTTTRGKFAVWADLLRELGLRGDERVLDLGCGRGAILLMVAQLLPAGRAVGIDLWKMADQSGNDPPVARRNAALEGVPDRVALVTGDMRQLPFTTTFDLVVSSLAIHNIREAAGRAAAIDEAVRALRPGGRLIIADFRTVDDYAARLRAQGMADIARRRLDWRFWYGGPWTATKLVTARKPA